MKTTIIILSILSLLSLISTQGCAVVGGIDLSVFAGKIQFAANIRDNTNQQLYNYEFTVCDNMNKPCGTKGPVGVCQEWDQTNTANLGGFQKVESIPNGIRIYYGDGDPYNGVPRSSTLEITCNENSEGVVLTALQNVVGTLTYNGFGTSKYVCTGGGGAGTTPVLFIFLMIFIGIFVIYLIAGFALNKSRNTEGFHPHQETIFGFPGLIKDGALFIGSKTCCRNQ